MCSPRRAVGRTVKGEEGVRGESLRFLPWRGDKLAPGAPARTGPETQAKGRPFQLMGSGKLPRVGDLALGPGIFLKGRGVWDLQASLDLKTLLKMAD